MLLQQICRYIKLKDEDGSGPRTEQLRPGSRPYFLTAICCEVCVLNVTRHHLLLPFNAAIVKANLMESLKTSDEYVINESDASVVWFPATNLT